MTTHTPERGDAASSARRRDAATTRQRLLDAAQRRFATDGYAATYVRDIAGDAGVNVALINRYFDSKEGLFRACLLAAVDEFRRTVPGDTTLDDVPNTMARQLADPQLGRHPSLLLLLRSSGDERADQIRLDILQSFAEGLATAAGRQTAEHDDQLILNAQVALATSLGIAILRSTGIQPLSSADQHQLAQPLRQVIEALLVRK